MYIYTSSIDVPTGELAFNINASDAEGRPLTYTLNGPNAGFFKVNENNGSVYIQRKLDREVWDGGFDHAFYQYLKSLSQIYSFMF